MKIAPLGPRLCAHLIDFAILNLVEVGLEYAIAKPLGLSAITEQVVGVVLSLILCAVYYIYIPVRYETTWGKRYCRLYVVDRDTLQPFTTKQAVTRALAYILSYATLGCGFLMAFFHPEKRALHDLIAGTVVVRKPEPLKTASA